MTKVEGVWATSAAREMFTERERDVAVEDYEERGPQYVAFDGGGFAYYEFSRGRTLVLGDNSGKVSLFTLEEILEAQQRE